MINCAQCYGLKDFDSYCVDKHDKAKKDTICKQCRKSNRDSKESARLSSTKKICPRCKDDNIENFYMIKSGPRTGKYHVFCRKCNVEIRKERRQIRINAAKELKNIENTIGPKRCRKCRETKPLLDFSIHQGTYRYGLPFPNCKKCHAEKHRINYRKDPSAYRKTSADSIRRSLKIRRAFVLYYKSRPCADCGHTYDPYCMEFDHLNPLTKNFNMGQGRIYSIDSIIDEIKKCEVVCSNCHKMRTAKRAGYDGFKDVIIAHKEYFDTLIQDFNI